MTYYINKKYVNYAAKRQLHFFVFITLVAFFNSGIFHLFHACIYSANFAGYTNITLIKSLLLLFGIALIGELVYILFLYYQKTHYSIINDFTQEYLEIEKAHFQELQQKDQNLRKFRHDIQGHLSIINSYLKDENYEQLVSYLHSMTDKFAPAKCRYQTGNSIIDTILNQKHPILEQQQIQLIIHNELSALNWIDDFDLCTLFSNAFQNAIDACTEIEDTRQRRIDIRLQSFNHIIALSISNSVNKKIKIKNNQIATSKQDKKNHGFGLVQIAQIIQNLLGELYLECSDSTFSLTVRLRKDMI